MGRYTGPKHKLSRREGKDLFGTGKPGLLRKLDRASGQYARPSGGRRAQSQYGKQLREKQKVKIMYGLRERQFKKLFEQAREITDIPTGTALLQLLEQRLDNVVYKLGLAKTRPQARQFVTQNRVLVDGDTVNVPSYLIKPGQSVTLRPKEFQSPFIQAILKEAISLPEWLKVEKGQGIVLRKPLREEIDRDIDENLIISFYTR